MINKEVEEMGRQSARPGIGDDPCVKEEASGGGATLSANIIISKFEMVDVKRKAEMEWHERDSWKGCVGMDWQERLVGKFSRKVSLERDGSKGLAGKG
jgi:hypothetical protein